jgi:hypothetical protein
MHILVKILQTERLIQDATFLLQDQHPKGVLKAIIIMMVFFPFFRLGRPDIEIAGV